jgi:Bacterial protein of unknown function (DUF922)
MIQKKFIFLLMMFCLFVLNNVQAQKIIISGKEGNRPLVWEDFAGKPDASSEHYAMTYWMISYKMANIQFEGNVAIIKGFEATLELNAKGSWLKKGKGTDELLVHEQMHFNTGLLCLKALLKKEKEIAPLLTRKNFSEKLQSMFDEVLKKYKEMGEKYDAETNHSKNVEQQKKWNEFFKEQLAL